MFSMMKFLTVARRAAVCGRIEAKFSQLFELIPSFHVSLLIFVRNCMLVYYFRLLKLAAAPSGSGALAVTPGWSLPG